MTFDDSGATATKAAPAWRARAEATAKRITGNVIVANVLAVINFANEAGATLFAAALAFSTMFAIVPIMLLTAGVLGWLIQDPAQRSQLLGQLVSYFPPLGNVFEAGLEGVVRERGTLSIIGLIGLLWGSSSLYGALDEVMRRLFPGGGIRGELDRRARGVITVVFVMVLIVGTVSLSGVWAFLGQLIGGLAIWGYVAPLLSLAVFVLVVLAVYVLVPTKPPSRRAALLPAIIAGIGVGLLTNLFSVLAPVLIGGLSGFGIIATVFGAFVWLNLSYQILLYGAAWARLRRDRESGAEKMALPTYA